MKKNMLINLFLSLALLVGACGPEIQSPIIKPGTGTVTGGSDDDKDTPKDPDYKVFTVYGKVTDAASGKGLKDVLVCDGTQFVKTGADGSYEIVPDTKKCQNVFVVMPSEYEFKSNAWGGWDDFVAVNSNLKCQKADFALTPRKNASDKFRLLLLGDPQQMSSRPHSGKSWTYVCNAIREYASTSTLPLYEISLGDMVTNEIEVPGMAQSYLSTQKTTGVTTFSVPGNHDHLQSAKTYFDSVRDFSYWFGPYNYSFNLGQQHFIFLDSCAWCEGEGSSKYAECLNEEALTFLENDLSFVSKSVPVHIFTHCPLTKKYNASFPAPKNYDRMIKALAGYDVNMWYGHIHFGSNYSYTANELSSHASGLKSLDSHVVARCGGCWSCSGEVCKDGTPRGFVELDIDGTSSKWQFHSIDENYDHDWTFYAPGRFAGEALDGVDDKALYCNVYLWDNLWSTPEIWVNGSKVGPMTKCKASTDASMDPLYQHFYVIWKAEGLMAVRDEPPSNSNNSHLFKYQLSVPMSSVEVHITDRWGREIVQKFE